MLRQIPWKKFLEWRVFETLEPFEAERSDWQTARVVQAVIHNGKPLKDFFLALGDHPGFHYEQQSLKTQELILDSWIEANNAIFAAKGNRGR